MTNNKQQTAVQEFRDKIALKLSVEQVNEFVPLFQQAKEMEKERAIKFACDVHMNVKKDKVKSLMQLVDEYYEQTYGGGEK
jgi:hypothetical protein